MWISIPPVLSPPLLRSSMLVIRFPRMTHSWDIVRSFQRILQHMRDTTSGRHTHRRMRGDAILAVPFIISLRTDQWVVGNTPRWVSGVRTDLVSLSLLARLSLPLNVNILPECVLVELALNAYGKVGVTLYDTLGDEAVGAFVRPKDWIHLELTLIPLRIHVRLIITDNCGRSDGVQHRPCSPYPYLHNL